MGQTNLPTNLFDQIKELRRELAEVRKSIGLSSARIDRGGLTLTNDAFLRMLDDSSVEILYAGPDSEGRQVVSLRREGGATVLYTYFAQPGLQYWALTDRTQNQIFADDAVSGVGIARPSFVWPTRTVAFDNLPSTSQATFTDVQDSGFCYKLQPKLSIQTIHCTTAADTSGEMKVLVDDVQVGSIVTVGFVLAFADVPPFNLNGTFMSQHRVRLQCRRTAGTGRVGAAMVIRGEQS